MQFCDRFIYKPCGEASGEYSAARSEISLPGSKNFIKKYLKLPHITNKLKSYHSLWHFLRL